MIYIENEGALFRSIGLMTEAPDEVYSPGEGWEPYKGETPKPQGWGERISEQEAKEMMARMDQAAKGKRR
jgi:hypothetical protein